MVETEGSVSTALAKDMSPDRK